MIKKYLLIFLFIIFIYVNCYNLSRFNNPFYNDFQKIKYTQNTAVSILKPTLTLYYDRYNKYSKYFYDDSKILYLQDLEKFQDNINEINKSQKFFEEMINNYLNEDNYLKEDNIFSIDNNNIEFNITKKKEYLKNKQDLIDSLQKSNFNFSNIIDDLNNLVITNDDRKINKKVLENLKNKLKVKFILNKEDLENKKKNFLNNQIESNDLDVWNQLKLIYSTNGFPFLNEDMITLEEVYCQDGKMPSCVNNKSIKYKIDDMSVPSPSPSPSPSTSITNLGIDKKLFTQFPRDEELVDKLPKIILTYQKYEMDGLVNNINTYVVEYEGIYNINNNFIKNGRNNVLKFVQDIMIERLEFKESNPIHTHTFEKEEEKINIMDKVVMLEDIKNNPELNKNIKEIFKCGECSEFEITYF